jgi:hypothetical protein
MRAMHAIEPAATDVAATFRKNVNELGAALSKVPQVQCPLVHRFAPGVYLREIHIPAGTVVIGKVHRTEHFNIMLKGVALIVHEDGSREELRAPLTFVSKAGVQKVVYILEDTIWQNVHPTTETDLKKLEADLVEPCEWAVPQVVAEEMARIELERTQ